MSAQRKKSIATIAIAVLLIITAEICRYIFTASNTNSFHLNNVRIAIYIFIFSAWCISISRRIIQKQAKQYLVTIASLMVFWIVIKALKQMYVTDVDAQRILWYLYYLPILFISFFSMLTAFHLGRAEDYRLPKWTNILYIPTIVLLILVLTNDLHFLAFSFPYGLDNIKMDEYSYGVVYYLVVIWCAVCYVTAFVVIVLRSIIDNRIKKIWLPFIPVGIGLVYFILYFLNSELIGYDISTATCLIVASVFECFFVTRFIHTNTGYGELFKLSTAGGQIADESFNIRLTSKDALPLTAEQIKSAIKAPIMLDNNIRLDAEKIGQGYILWQEDISSLVDTINKLDEINVELEDYYSVLREETAQKQEILKIKEQNRLFTQTEHDTAKSIKEVSSLLSEITITDDCNMAKKLLKRAIVISAYIKRRTNMIFVLSQLNCIPYIELKSCFDESIRSLDSAGVDCAVVVSECDYSDVAKNFYDFFETIIEKYFESIKAMLVSIDNDKIVVTVNADCDEISTPDYPEAVIVRDDDGLFYCTLKTGGEADA